MSSSQDLTENDAETNKLPLNIHPANQPDEYVNCPYFPEHQLRRSRLPYHLIKCQKNPRAPNLVACPFNYMHRIKPEDRETHVTLCPDRIAKKYVDRKPPSYANTREEVFKISKREFLRDCAAKGKISDDKPEVDSWY